MEEAGDILRLLATRRVHPESDRPLASIPLPAALRAHPRLVLGPTDGALVAVEPVDPVASPPVPDLLVPWISGDADRASFPPRLRAKATTGTQRRRAVVERIHERPDVRDAWTQWQGVWQEWSRSELQDRPLVALYRRLEAVVAGMDEILGQEIVVSFVQAGRVDDDDLRNVAVVPVRPTRQPRRSGEGSLTLQASGLGGIRLDLDALGYPDAPAETRALLDEAASCALDVLRPWEPHALDPLLDALRAAVDPDVELLAEPVIVVRHQAMLPATAFVRANDRLRAGSVPGALLPLSSRRGEPHHVTTPGALVRVADGGFCPFPLDADRVRILDGLDRDTQTVVHTRHREPELVGAILTHLLAQGRTVLVTAPDVDELTGVRAGVPDPLRPLVVSASEPSTLGESLEHLVRHAAEGPEDVPAHLRQIRTRIARLTARRRRHLGDADERAARRLLVHTVGTDHGTVAELTARHARDAHLDWITEFLPDGPPPATSDVGGTQADLDRLAELLADRHLQTLDGRFHGGLVDPTDLPSPIQFGMLLDVFDLAASAVPPSADPDHPATRLLIAASSETRGDVRDLLRQIDRHITQARAFPGQWMDLAVRDIRRGDAGAWFTLLRTLDALVTEALADVEAIGAEITFLADLPDLPDLVAQVRRHLAVEPITVDEYGNPRLGVEVSPGLAAAHRLAMYVRVDDRPPSTPAQLDALDAHLRAHATLDRLDDAWPTDTVWTDETSAASRLRDHISRFRALRDCLDLADLIAAAGSVLRQIGLDVEDWEEDAVLTSLERLLLEAELLDAAGRLGAPLSEMALGLRESAAAPDAPDALDDLARAAVALDAAAYGRALAELTDLAARAGDLLQLRALRAPLQDELPGLVESVAADPERRGERLRRLFEALAHARLGAWLEDHAQPADPAGRLATLTALDAEIESAVVELAAARAWSHQPASGLPEQTRVDLMLHAHLARRLRENGGTERQHAELRRLQARARWAVPAQVMPLSDIATQAGQVPSFDVVIVLGAGRIGVEGTLARTLGTRIAFFGEDSAPDDPWVTPEFADAVSTSGRHAVSRWADPDRSLFGDALTRGGTRVVLDDPTRLVHEVADTARSAAPGATTPSGLRCLRDALGDAAVSAADIDLAGLPVGMLVRGPNGLVAVLHGTGRDASQVAWVTRVWRHRGLRVVPVDDLDLLTSPDAVVDLVRREAGLTSGDRPAAPSVREPAPAT